VLGPRQPLGSEPQLHLPAYKKADMSEVGLGFNSWLMMAQWVLTALPAAAGDGWMIGELRRRGHAGAHSPGGKIADLGSAAR
jgi:hypothetical protein